MTSREPAQGPDPNDGDGVAQEIADSLAELQAARQLGEVNTSRTWQVRIAWHCEPPVVWPPFTTDRRTTQEEATGIALAALRWIPDPQLHVTGVAVRGPGESAWHAVHLPQTAAA